MHVHLHSEDEIAAMMNASRTGMTFVRPTSAHEAIDILKREGDGAKVIAGGTALVLMMSHRLIAPRCLVALDRIPAFDALYLDAEGLRIGAMSLLGDVARSPLVRERYPALALALGVVGNVRIRNQGTVAGNLAHADYASDPPTMLATLGASVDVLGRNGPRRVSVDELILGPYTTALEPEEIITQIVVPLPLPGTRMRYMRFASRAAEDRPSVTVGVAARFEDGGVCRALRVTVGAAYETPRRVYLAETLAPGNVLTAEVIREIADASVDRSELLDDIRGSRWFRERLLRVCVRRTLEQVRDARP